MREPEVYMKETGLYMKETGLYMKETEAYMKETGACIKETSPYMKVVGTHPSACLWPACICRGRPSGLRCPPLEQRQAAFGCTREEIELLPEADDRERPRSRGLDGRRRAARRSVVARPSVHRFLPAAFRAGHRIRRSIRTARRPSCR